MRLSDREVLLIKICLITLVVAALLWLVVNPVRVRWSEAGRQRADDRRGFLALKENVEKKKQLDRSISALGEKLGVKVQTGSPNEQRQAFIKEVDEVAKKNNAKIGSFVPSRSLSRRRRTAGTSATADYSISLETNQQGLVQFLKGLEGMARPVVFDSIDVKANEKEPDKLKVNLVLHTFIFDGRAL
jgi:plasmid stabilization system protein ParE